MSKEKFQPLDKVEDNLRHNQPSKVDDFGPANPDIRDDHRESERQARGTKK